MSLTMRLSGSSTRQWCWWFGVQKRLWAGFVKTSLCSPSCKWVSDCLQGWGRQRSWGREEAPYFPMLPLVKGQAVSRIRDLQHQWWAVLPHQRWAVWDLQHQWWAARWAVYDIAGEIQIHYGRIHIHQRPLPCQAPLFFDIQYSLPWNPFNIAQSI